MVGWTSDQRPWEGPNRCIGTTVGGTPCSNYEIDGLEHCFWHIPEDMLEEAEEVTGLTRCREPGCRSLAMEGTVPPRCGSKHAQAGTVMSVQAAARVVEGRVQDKFTEIMAAEGQRLLHPPKIGDPFTELLELASRVKEMETILLDMVSTLKPIQWRYTGKAGEQTRAEIVLLERAQERLGQMLISIVKLGIEDRLAGVEEATLVLIERALGEAFRRAGADITVQDKAREILRQELPVLAA